VNLLIDQYISRCRLSKPTFLSIMVVKIPQVHDVAVVSNRLV